MPRLPLAASEAEKVTARSRPPLITELRAAVPGAEVRHYASTSALEADTEAADIIATNRLSPSALARARRLKGVQSWSAGPDELLFPEMIASPVVMTICKGNGLAEAAAHRVLPLDFRRQAPREVLALTPGITMQDVFGRRSASRPRLRAFVSRVTTA